MKEVGYCCLVWSGPEVLYGFQLLETTHILLMGGNRIGVVAHSITKLHAAMLMYHVLFCYVNYC